MKLLNFELWFYIYLTNTNKFLLNLKRKDYNRFLSLFHGRLVAAVFNWRGRSTSKRRTKKGLNYYIFFFWVN